MEQVVRPCSLQNAQTFCRATMTSTPSELPVPSQNLRGVLYDTMQAWPLFCSLPQPMSLCGQCGLNPSRIKRQAHEQDKSLVRCRAHLRRALWWALPPCSSLLLSSLPLLFLFSFSSSSLPLRFSLTSCIHLRSFLFVLSSFFFFLCPCDCQPSID